MNVWITFLNRTACASATLDGEAVVAIVTIGGCAKVDWTAFLSAIVILYTAAPSKAGVITAGSYVIPPTLTVVIPPLYPAPLLSTTKCDIVFSLAILNALPSSSKIVSPSWKVPERTLTKILSPLDSLPSADPSITAYALLLDPVIYLPDSNEPSGIVLSSLIWVKKVGLKYDNLNVVL